LPDNTSICVAPSEPDRVTWTFYYGSLNIAVFKTILPFTIMITISVIIVKTILKSKKNLLSKKDHLKERQLAKSLVALDTFFIICSLPLTIFALLNPNTGHYYSFFYFLTKLYTVFLFIVFYIANNINRNIFKQYMSKIFPLLLPKTKTRYDYC
jgi:hypothetical protein